MPNRIHLLPEQVANQIAAGEVIERPASVLKELLENSLDAGATQIDVVSRNGGRSLLLLTDNGCGMSRDDALLCLERHATSKIRESGDLARIASYGFRGEALPSIASVSRFTLSTRESESLAGTELIVNGGKLTSVKETGMAPGTRIEVRSLFFNLPARRKFLRTENTEKAHLQHQLILAGLARPEVGFVVTHDDNPPERWPAGQSLASRIAAVYGADWSKMLVPIEAEDGDLRLHGFIGQPGVSRANRQEQHFFINRRPVDNRTLHFGLLEGYHNTLMRGRYPVTVLFLEMDPAGLDVNIHPAKREVRFHDDARLRHFIVRAVQTALRKFQAMPVSVPLSTGFRDQKQEVLISPSLPSEHKRSLPSEAPALVPHDLPLSPSKSSEMSSTPAVPAFQNPASEIRNRMGFRLLGVVAHLYIIAESPEGLVLIDQHAAHERILFEQMLDRLRHEEVKSQRLLLPVTVEFPPREADFLKAQLDSLSKIGVGISLFGAASFLVDALPPMVKTKNVAEFIRTLAVELQEAGGETRKARRLSEEVVAKTVCRHAVKANDRLRPDECEKLIQDLLACDLPYTCPHGRPTMIQISRVELEKKFGRAG
jgi:DNA mismatch repair protein MutL